MFSMSIAEMAPWLCPFKASQVIEENVHTKVDHNFAPIYFNKITIATLMLKSGKISAFQGKILGACPNVAETHNIFSVYESAR